jgi:hypothetical protein
LRHLLKHAGEDSAAVVFAWVDLAAPAWAVSPVRVLVGPALLALEELGSLVREWGSLALEELGSLVREWGLLVREELGSLVRVESGPAEALG